MVVQQSAIANYFIAELTIKIKFNLSISKKCTFGVRQYNRSASCVLSFFSLCSFTAIVSSKKNIVSFLKRLSSQSFKMFQQVV